uniref:Uncharacterized protein n=1 Tax=Ciona savignyi TaxID=51511 RepID=H2Z1B7_CIOSA
MDVSVLLLVILVLLFFCLIATVIYLLYFVGILGAVAVSVGKPCVKRIVIAYKNHKGPYKNCGPHFSEAYSLCPHLQSIGIYYDSPNEIPANELRYAVGLILAEGRDEPDPELIKLVESHEFEITELPEIDHAVKSQFPLHFDLCSIIGAWKVYPVLNDFIQRKRLSAHPFIEIYSKGIIHYFAPLSKQSDFFVPGVKYKPDYYINERDR